MKERNERSYLSCEQLRRSGEAVTSNMPDTILRPGVVDDTMPRHGMGKSNDLPRLEVVIADSLICDRVLT
jgi:hypothetical protein